MPDDAPQPPLPPLGDFRPVRQADAEPELGVTVIPRLPGADPESAPPPMPHDRVGRSASALAACAAHVLVLLALVSAPPTDLGGGGDVLDAISVSIIPASALDAPQPVADLATSAASPRVAPEPGDDSTPAQASPERPAPPKEMAEVRATEPSDVEDRDAAPAEPASAQALDEAPEITSAPAAPEETRVAAVEPPPRPQPPEVREKPPDDPPAEPSSQESSAGGSAASHGTDADQPARPAAAAASRGEVDAYGMAVQSALLAVDQREAKARVAAAQAKGTVIVRIVIGSGGGLERAEIVTSSGRPQLDEAALLLIRRTAFPPPPTSLSADQRTYLAPIRFR